MKKILITFLFFVLCDDSICHAQSSPEELLKSRMRTPLLRTEDTMTGEGLCWHAAYRMGRFMDEYRKTHDEGYLDAAIRYYDALIEKMHVSPDGYKGWVGPYIYDEDYIGDVHIGDAILINHMLDFSETVLRSEKEIIVQKYEEKVKEYLELAKKHLIEKWDRRGTWFEDGRYGAYRSWDHYMTPSRLNEWRILPVTKSNLSLPFNKQNSMGIACLRIYRITGEEFYREKALKIFNFMKSRMCLYQDHYVWNYWEPFGPWDIESSSPNKLRHWVNVHPYRNYQAGEIYEIVEAYHSGITFTKEDIQRIINTNLKVMWNGDKENPQWHNSNYAVQMAALGRIPITEPPGGEFPELAGTLWRGLMDFDSTIRELAHRKIDTPPSFIRKYPDLPVTEFHRPFHSNKYFTMAAVIPSTIDNETTTYIVSQTRVSGHIEVELFDKEGKTKIADIRKKDDKIAKKDQVGLLILKWNRENVTLGEYRVRWTLHGECREFPVLVK